MIVRKAGDMEFEHFHHVESISMDFLLFIVLFFFLKPSPFHDVLQNEVSCEIKRKNSNKPIRLKEMDKL